MPGNQPVPEPQENDRENLNKNASGSGSQRTWVEGHICGKLFGKNYSPSNLRGILKSG